MDLAVVGTKTSDVCNDGIDGERLGSGNGKGALQSAAVIIRNGDHILCGVEVGNCRGRSHHGTQTTAPGIGIIATIGRTTSSAYRNNPIHRAGAGGISDERIVGQDLQRGRLRQAAGVDLLASVGIGHSDRIGARSNIGQYLAGLARYVPLKIEKRLGVGHQYPINTHIGNQRPIREPITGRIRKFRYIHRKLWALEDFNEDRIQIGWQVRICNDNPIVPSRQVVDDRTAPRSRDCERAIFRAGSGEGIPGINIGCYTAGDGQVDGAIGKASATDAILRGLDDQDRVSHINPSRLQFEGVAVWIVIYAAHLYISR